MKRLSLIGIIALLLAGCVAPAVDSEFGVAQRTAWQQQIAFPEASLAGQRLEGQEGLVAEEIMTVHLRTFAREAQRSDVFSLDLTGGQGR
jgi:hypothetical protein